MMPIIDAIDIAEGLNEQQKKATLNPINICTKIVAGAGTGKTKIISKRFVKLVQDLITQDVVNPVEKLLVITFTDKAAGEMKERIVSELSKSGIDSTGEELWISTIHSFCSRILRKHSIEANLSPAFKLGEETQLKEIFDNILKRIKYNESSTIDNLSIIATELGLDSDLLSVSSINKLRDISALDNVLDDIYPLIKKIKSLGLTPKEFLEKTLSSTNDFSNITCSIPFCGESKDEYVNNWNEHLRAYIEDSISLNSDVFDKISSTKIILNKNAARGKNACLQWTKATGFPENMPKILDLELHLTKIVALIYAVYQSELEKLDLVDFDDLINKTIQILKQNEVIRSYYQKHFAHIIIDEFQDTNGAQLELIELLLSDDCPNITFVGDRKQSIYGFRFAQMENLDVLAKHIAKKYGKDKVDEITLITNYRSTPSVLTAVNTVTTEELGLDEKLFAGRSFVEKDKPIKVSLLEGFNDAYTHKCEEAKYIASEIVRLKKQDVAKYKDFAVLVKSHAHAELISKQLIKYGIPSIKKVNTGFFENSVVKNAVALFRLVKNVRDEIALIRLLSIKLSDGDIYKLKLAIDSQIEYLLDKSAIKKMNFADKILVIQEKGLWAELQVADNVKSYSRLIVDSVLKASKAQNQLSLLQIYYKLTNEIALYFNITGIEQYNVELDLRVFEKIIVDYQQSQNYVSVKTFLEYLENAKDDKNFELPNLAVKDVDAVQLFTIYASKGLEFPYTFVANIKNKQGNSQDNTIISFDLQYGGKPGFGLIVHKFKGKDTPKAVLYKEIWKKPRQKNEDLRLFYVAVSRAEHYLNVLSFSPYGNNGGTKPVDYVQHLSESYPSKPINVTDLDVEKQDYKPSFTVNQQRLNENVCEIKELKTDFNMSFSKISTFNHCNAKYLFEHKYHYPSLGLDNDKSLVGSTFHNLIYTGFINNKEFSITEIPLSLLNISSEDALVISKLYESFLKSDYSPKKLIGKEFFAERNFNFCLELNGANIKFAGDIDLLVKNSDDSYTIVDFKTNKEIETSLENYYMQLYIYKIALEKEGLTVSSAKIINLIEGEPKVFDVSSENFKAAKNNLEKTLKEIIVFEQDEKIPEIRIKESCKYCGHRYLCSN